MEENKMTKITRTVGVVRERERESNRLEEVAQICDTKNVNENRANNVIVKIERNIDKQKRVDYIANRRKAKLLFTG